MNELIKIQDNGNGLKTVNARDLHEFLEIGKDFSNWIKSKIKEYNLIENQDYVKIQAQSLAKFGELGNQAFTKIEYYLSLDAAKSLAMVTNNEKGKQARRYFLECEKIAKGQQTRYEKMKCYLEHLDIEQQKLNSKKVNTYNYINGGKATLIQYNIQNCIGHTGMKPNSVISYGKQLGLKSKDTTSSKQVLRKIHPEKACCMSLTDQLVERGIEINKAIEASKQCEIGFKALINVGAIPAELN